MGIGAWFVMFIVFSMFTYFFVIHKPLRSFRLNQEQFSFYIIVLWLIALIIFIAGLLEPNIRESFYLMVFD